MDHREAFNTVIKVHKIKAVDIAKKSGVDVHEISKFRNGHKDMTATIFFKIVDALPPVARSHFSALRQIKDAEPEISYKDKPKKAMKVAETTGKYKV